MPDLGSENLNQYPEVMAPSVAQVEAKTSAVSNWFYYLGTGLADALDGTSRAPIANAGVNLGVGPDGSVYIQGQAAGQGQAARAATFSVSPTLLLIGALVFVLMRSNKG